MRELFLDEGVDEQVLLELKTVIRLRCWEKVTNPHPAAPALVRSNGSLCLSAMGEQAAAVEGGGGLPHRGAGPADRPAAAPARPASAAGGSGHTGPAGYPDSFATTR